MDRTVVVRLGPLSLDHARRMLERDGRPVSIGGRGASLLRALIVAHGQVVTRTELLEAAWPGQIVEERNLTVQIATLRQALAELCPGEDPIRTVSRVGYRLVLDGVPAQSDTIHTLRPMVAVLPFANLSADQELAFFSDGVTEDIIASLSRFRAFAVAARGSSFTYKGKLARVPEIVQALGVRYVVEGSLRRHGQHLRVAVQLSDADGAVRWADCFEEELDGVFEVQDRITAGVVRLLQPQITRAELERSRRKHPETLDAYDHFLLGRACSDEISTGRDVYDRMVAHLDRSVELDPHFPQGLIEASKAHGLRVVFGGSSPPGVEDFAISADLADRSLALDPNDAMVVIGAAMRIHTHGDDEEGALALAERAVALNPHHDMVLGTAGMIQRQRGRTGEAIRLLEHALRLSPNSPSNAMQVENIGCCHLYDGRYVEAVGCFRRALALGASWDLALVNLTVAEALSGEMDAARATLERFLRVRPGATIRSIMDRLPPGTRRCEERAWPEGLRRAGLPVG
jgi:TolB-like protein/cytochrome c-type biogenesis protein CcmH/NrfG